MRSKYGIRNNGLYGGISHSIENMTLWIWTYPCDIPEVYMPTYALSGHVSWSYTQHHRILHFILSCQVVCVMAQA